MGNALYDLLHPPTGNPYALRANGERVGKRNFRKSPRGNPKRGGLKAGYRYRRVACQRCACLISLNQYRQHARACHRMRACLYCGSSYPCLDKRCPRFDLQGSATNSDSLQHAAFVNLLPSPRRFETNADFEEALAVIPSLTEADREALFAWANARPVKDFNAKR